MNFLKLSLLSITLFAGSTQLQAMQKDSANPSFEELAFFEKCQERALNNLKNVPPCSIVLQQLLSQELAKDPRAKCTPFGIVADKQTTEAAVKKVLQTPLGKYYAMLIIMNQAPKSPKSKS